MFELFACYNVGTLTVTNLFTVCFQLPFETEIYFVQHFLMMIIPYYLIAVGGKLKATVYTLIS